MASFVAQAASTSAALTPVCSSRPQLRTQRSTPARTAVGIRAPKIQQLCKARTSIKVSAAAGSAESSDVQFKDLLQLNKDDYYSFIEAQSNLVVVDFYTDWCGPCKMIYPKLAELNATYEDVEMAKFNCNKDNKDLGKELGIKVAPTFFLYKDGNKVAEMTGAKVDKLVELIENYK